MRSPLVALVTTGLLAATAPAANAETWDARDARRDVDTYTYSSDPPPCGTSTDGTDPNDKLRDITRLRVDHDPDTITVRVSMRELRRRGADTSWTIHLRVPAGSFFVDVIRAQPSGKLLTFLAKEPHFTPPDDCGHSFGTSSGRACEGLAATLDPGHGVLEVTLPRECVKEPRWVKVGVAVSGFTGTAEAFTIHDDAWPPPGVESSGYVPPYGPRVRPS